MDSYSKLILNMYLIEAGLNSGLEFFFLYME
jgi:hypothetical protein